VRILRRTWPVTHGYLPATDSFSPPLHDRGIATSLRSVLRQSAYSVLPVPPPTPFLLVLEEEISLPHHALVGKDLDGQIRGDSKDEIFVW